MARHKNEVKIDYVKFAELYYMLVPMRLIAKEIGVSFQRLYMVEKRTFGGGVIHFRDYLIELSRDSSREITKRNGLERAREYSREYNKKVKERIKVDSEFRKRFIEQRKVINRRAYYKKKKMCGPGVHNRRLREYYRKKLQDPEWRKEYYRKNREYRKRRYERMTEAERAAEAVVIREKNKLFLERLKSDPQKYQKHLDYHRRLAREAYLKRKAKKNENSFSNIINNS